MHWRIFKLQSMPVRTIIFPRWTRFLSLHCIKNSPTCSLRYPLVRSFPSNKFCRDSTLPLNDSIPRFKLTYPIRPPTSRWRPLATAMPTEQRVGPFPITHDVQRVASPLSPDKDLISCPTLILFSTQSPPGRTALPPGGDNISYTRLKLCNTSSTRMSSTARPRDPTPVPRVPLIRPCPVNTHVGKWQVKRVVHHHGRDTHRTKLQFRVQCVPRYMVTLELSTLIRRNINFYSDYTSPSILSTFSAGGATAYPSICK